MPIQRLLNLIVITMLLCFCLDGNAKPHYATIVMEYPSKNILFSENPNSLNQPASLTKVMTLYLVFQALDRGTLTLTQLMHVSSHAANRQPSKLGLRANETIAVEDAICGLVTKSANDAASVIAENMAPTENDFALRMTQEARRLGLNNTTFKNASGVPDNSQLTTALDMATLGAAIMRDFPHYYHYFSLKEFTYRNHVFKNHNHLLGKYIGCDGIKTGYTAASGFNLLSSATRDGHRLIAVVLGGSSIKSRDNRMMQILDAGFHKLASSASTNKPMPLTIQNLEKPNTLPANPSPNTALPVTSPANSEASPPLKLPDPQAYLDPSTTTIEEEY